MITDYPEFCKITPPRDAGILPALVSRDVGILPALIRNRNNHALF